MAATFRPVSLYLGVLINCKFFYHHGGARECRFFEKLFLEDQRHFDGSSSCLRVKVWFTHLQSEGARLAAAVIGVKTVRETGISEFETNVLLIEMMY